MFVLKNLKVFFNASCAKLKLRLCLEIFVYFNRYGSRALRCLPLLYLEFFFAEKYCLTFFQIKLFYKSLFKIKQKTNLNKKIY